MVNAKTKRQMFAAAAPQVQLLGVVELRRVAVRRANAQGDQRAGGQVHTAQLGGLQRAAVAQLVGRLEAQKLIHRQIQHRITRRIVRGLLHVV